MPYNPNLKTQSLTGSIFEAIRGDIVSGRYKPGEKLNEAKLASEMKVSRTPVREALKQLISDGIVESIPNRGIIVIGISQDDFKDILMIRSAIDKVAIRWSMTRITEDELKSLSETYELMEFYTAKGDLEKIFQLITQFHEIIYRSTKSPYLEKVLINFQFITKSLRYESLKKEGRLAASLKEHGQLLEAFQNSDLDSAMELMSHHGTSLNQIVNS